MASHREIQLRIAGAVWKLDEGQSRRGLGVILVTAIATLVSGQVPEGEEATERSQ